jgi:inorganic triphosphatase YgiF
MREVELKFELAAEAGRKLPRTRLLRGVKPVTQPLRAIYFDTPDHRLAARGIALRVRREGERWVQTLKSGGGANGGLHARDEIEAERPDASVDPRLFARTPLTAALRGAGTSLRPVFEVHVDRTTWTVKMGRRDRVEVALDRGHVRHGRKRTPIHELEIESKAGDPAAVFDAADRLLDHVALHPSSVSKAQRG